MLQKRIIPILLLHNGSLVKTVKFKNFNYIGNPANTIRIFNELEVDEIILVDILASRKNSKPDFEVIKEVAEECFMPLTYGGGLKTMHDVKKLLSIGVEKVAINTFASESPEFISELASTFGNQCIIGSIDVRKDIFGRYYVTIKDGTKKTKLDPLSWSKKLEELGAGELLVTSVDNDGTWGGYDETLIKSIADNVSIPVIGNGGAGSFNDVKKLFTQTNCSAAGVGSLVLYQKKGMGVLINFPEENDIQKILDN